MVKETQKTKLYLSETERAVFFIWIHFDMNIEYLNPINSENRHLHRTKVKLTEKPFLCHLNKHLFRLSSQTYLFWRI